MNVYDTVNQLANEIKNSEEYIEYKNIKEVVNSNPELKTKMEKFEKARYEAQVATINGEEPSSEQIQTMQKAYLELINNEITKKYLETELKFNTMLADINKVLSEVVKELM